MRAAHWRRRRDAALAACRGAIGRGLPTSGRRLAALAIALVLTAHPAARAQTADGQEPRVALVVGNGAYTQVPALANAVSDAQLIAGRLEAAGFDVMLVENAELDDFQTSVIRFGRRLREAGPEATGLFYYAGHAVQSFGANYLLPTTLSLTDQADLDVVALEASSILRQMRSARNRTNLFILDSCRNNPFETILDFNENGLAEMDAPTGTFISYATAPGEVALDGAGEHSPFTTALANRMLAPGAPVEWVFRQVRVDVIEATGGRQTPWDASSLTREFHFIAAEEPSPEEMAERSMWDSVRRTREPVEIALFLRAFPESRFQSDARALLAEVATGSRAVIVETPQPEPAPAAAAPTANETALFQTAQAQGTREAYEAYLSAFPSGTFAEFARAELAALAPAAKPETGELTATLSLGTDAPPLAAPDQQVASLPDAGAPVRFDAPLATGLAAFDGRSLEQLVAGTPVFPPVEGLPESFWKDQTCANCHVWQRENLCDQARTYLAKDDAALLGKPHPYGGPFKTILRAWAEGDCK